MPLEPDPRIDAIAASGLVSSALLAALVAAVARKGLLSDKEVREIYEHALLLLEQHDDNEPTMKGVYEAAREVIEAELRGDEQ